MYFVKITINIALTETQSILFESVFKGAMNLYSKNNCLKGYVFEIKDKHAYLGFGVSETDFSFSMHLKESTEIFQLSNIEKNSKSLPVEIACAALAILFGEQVEITTSVPNELVSAASYVCDYIDSSGYSRSATAPSWALSEQEVMDRLLGVASEPTLQLC